jgi:hypothetical protein
MAMRGHQSGEAHHIGIPLAIEAALWCGANRFSGR